MQDLLILVAACLPSPEDTSSFRAVCQQWRTAADRACTRLSPCATGALTHSTLATPPTPPVLPPLTPPPPPSQTPSSPLCTPPGSSGADPARDVCPRRPGPLGLRCHPQRRRPSGHPGLPSPYPRGPPARRLPPHKRCLLGLTQPMALLAPFPLLLHNNLTFPPLPPPTPPPPPFSPSSL